MAELRLDITTKEWAIIATERGRRPNDFQRKSPEPVKPAYVRTCPFCPGNEHMSPPPLLNYNDEKTGVWKLRVVPNTYPAVTPKGDGARKKTRGIFLSTEAYGHHEVVIETPQHNRNMALMDEADIHLVLQAYLQRYLELSADPRIKTVIIFRNHGMEAGTSLEHPHSQIVAASIIPRSIRMRHEVAISYYDDNGVNLYTDLTKGEIEDGRRILIKTDKFTIFHPFASHRPFETWVMPADCQASFGKASENDLPALASVLKTILSGLYYGLNDPDYNMVIDSAPSGEENNELFQWHIRIIPRINKRAGFEIGSGININTVKPEDTAKYIRELKLTAGQTGKLHEER